jgi:hypothetical protein
MRKFALLVLVGCTEQAAPPPTVAIDFPMLASYEFKLGVAVPDAVRAFHGKKVTITGFMYPSQQTRGITEFILMKDRGTCCYGPKVQWTHFLTVTCARPVDYSPEPVTFVGTFRVDPQVDKDYVLGLYYLDAE